jgi:membrane protease YdiL (CAAX protease family)
MLSLKYFDKFNNLQFLLGTAMILAIYGQGLSWVINRFFNPELLRNIFFDEMSLVEKFIAVVIIAPLFETFFFQFLIIESGFYLAKKLNIPNRELYAIGISSILFGLSHHYNIYYVINFFFAGVFLAVVYIVSKERKSLNAFFSVFFVHAFTNFSGFVYEYLTS